MKNEKPRPPVPKKTMRRFQSASQWLWAFLAITGLLLLITGLWKAQRMLGCSSWPVTQGNVLKSELERGHLREGSLKYRYRLVYKYTVERQEYRNQRISFDGTAPGNPQTRFLPTRYPVGTAVSVHYNKANPKLAVIETHVTFKGLKPLVMGVIMTLIGIGGLYWRWPLQTDYLFREHDPEEPLTKIKVLLGSLGLLTCLGIVWLWWELIKMYAGR